MNMQNSALDTSIMLDVPDNATKTIPDLKNKLTGDSKLIIPDFLHREILGKRRLGLTELTGIVSAVFEKDCVFKTISEEEGYKIREFVSRFFDKVSADTQLLAYCRINDQILVTLDKKLLRLANQNKIWYFHPAYLDAPQINPSGTECRLPDENKDSLERDSFGTYSPSYRIHVDASFDEKTRMGKIGWVVCLYDKPVSTSVLLMIRRKTIQSLEELVFKIVNQIYKKNAKTYADSASVWEDWKGRNKNKICLTDSKNNVADRLLNGKDIPLSYKKIPTFRSEYIRVRETESGDKLVRCGNDMSKKEGEVMK